MPPRHFSSDKTCKIFSLKFSNKELRMKSKITNITPKLQICKKKRNKALHYAKSLSAENVLRNTIQLIYKQLWISLRNNFSAGNT
jgi:hypothetical protein